MTHWKSLINLDYIGAYALDGKDKVLTIKSVGKEIVTGANGKKEECIVAHFKEDEKPMILNRTNCKTIQKLYGTPDIEQWAGKKIQVYASTTKLAGDVVECLRIRDYITPPKAAIICSECGQEITATERMSVDAIIINTTKKYGKPICAECHNKHLAEKQQDKPVEQQPTVEGNADAK